MLRCLLSSFGKSIQAGRCSLPWQTSGSQTLFNVTFVHHSTNSKMLKYVTVTKTKRRKLENSTVLSNMANSDNHGHDDTTTGIEQGGKSDMTVDRPHSADCLASEGAQAAVDSSTIHQVTSPQKVTNGQKFVFEEKNGDLFTCPMSWSLAHCVSVDLHMGKGIAVIFKKIFGKVDELRKQGAKMGGCAVLKKEDRFVYYLTTKEKYSHKPTYETLRSSLEVMQKHCQTNNVTNVAMPTIGCGLDRLEWPKVKDIIKDIFKNTPITITVFVLGKSEGANASKKPKPNKQWQKKKK